MSKPSESNTRSFWTRPLLPPICQSILTGVVLLFFAFLVFVGAVVPHLTWLFPQNSWAYGLQYDVPSDHVTVEPKPHGCDFEDAPLGEKHCHYKAFVIVQGDCTGSINLPDAGPALVQGESTSPKSSGDCRFYYPSLPQTEANRPTTNTTRILVSWDKVSD